MSACIEAPLSKVCVGCGAAMQFSRGMRRNRWLKKKYCTRECFTNHSLAEARAKGTANSIAAKAERAQAEQTKRHLPLVADASCHKYLDTCAYTPCRYHLEHDDSKQSRNSRGVLYASRVEARRRDGVTETCSLRAASRGALTREEVAKLYGVTPEHIWTITEEALVKIQRAVQRGEHRTLREFL